MKMTRARQAFVSSLLITTIAAVSPVIPGATARDMPRTVTIYGAHDNPADYATRAVPSAPPAGIVRSVTPVLRHKAPAPILKALRQTTTTKALQAVKEGK